MDHPELSDERIERLRASLNDAGYMSKAIGCIAADLMGGNAELRADGEKQCSRCGEFKMPDDFDRNKNTRDGRASHCKKCRAAAVAKKAHGGNKYGAA